MERKNKEYSEDFKKMIVELFEQGRSATELTREYGIVNSRSVYTWAKKYSKIKINEKGNAKEAAITVKDYEKLQKQMKQVQEENEILKKAVAIFTKK